MGESQSGGMTLFPKLLLGVCGLCLVAGLYFHGAKQWGAANSGSTAEVSEGGVSIDIIDTLSRIKKEHLLVLHLDGPISMESDSSPIGGASESNAVQVRKGLNEAYKDDDVKGVLLAINSPGGTVGMSQELHAAVTRLRKKKPVVAYFGDVAASGGYYTAVAADRIVSNPGTLTASIGVIMQALNFKELLVNKLGVRSNTIKSGKFKDLLNPFRETRQDELALLQGLIDDSYQQFLGVVLEGRTKHLKDPAEVEARKKVLRSIADGRVVTGQQGYQLGLVDKLGDIHEAHLLLDELAKEHHGLGGEEPLPLEESTDGSKILRYINMLGAAFSPVVASQSSSSTLGQMMEQSIPFSMKHPNQPLWLME